MPDQPAEPEPLTVQEEHSINLLMLNVALRNLIAQIASADRNAKEATEYVKSFKRSLKEFILEVQANDDRFDGRLIEEMHKFSRLLLDGISFKDD